jgi:ABC-2 type transport system permease protein
MNWPQLKTILWLQTRLARNQWARSGGIGAVLGALLAISAVVLAFTCLIGGFAVGAYAFKDLEPVFIMMTWLGMTMAFVVFWSVGLIAELQRSETVDLQRLMHLPVLLGQIFVVNYVASLAAVSVLLYVSLSLGVSLGMSVSLGPRMLLMIPLALSMVFMVTAWTYLLRGWLAALMSNPRRRRAIVMGLTMALILIVQLPNLYFNVFNRESREERRARRAESREVREARDEQAMQGFQEMARWQMVAPPFWVSAGVEPLVAGRPLPAMLGLAGCLALGSLGLRRAYRSTLRFYLGESGGLAQAAGARPSSPAPIKVRTPSGGRERVALVERRLPGVPDVSSAVGFANFQSILRAPEVKMQWGTSFIITSAVGGSLLFRSASTLPAWAGPFIATAVVVFQLFMVIGFVANQFGHDRDGFRAYVLSPVERWKILVGKNLAAFPAAAMFSIVLVTILSVWLRLSPLAYLATLFQLIVAVLCAMMFGNLLSILLPYRIQPGSMKPTKMPALAMLVLIVSQLTLPLALSPTFIPPLAGFLLERGGYAPAALVNLLLSGSVAAVMALIYWKTLPPMGRLLQRRETKILQTVSESVE